MEKVKCVRCHKKINQKDGIDIKLNRYRCKKCDKILQKPTHDHTCESCDQLATRVVEMVWTETPILSNGDLGKEQITDGVDDSSHFYCDEHDE